MTEEEHKEVRNLVYEALSNSIKVIGVCVHCRTTRDLRDLETQGFFITRCRKCCIKDLITYYWFYTSGKLNTAKNITYDLQRRSTGT